MSIIFILVTVSLYTYSIFSAKLAGIENPTSVTTLVALLVCLAPTTIGALLSAIGIAGMSRLNQTHILDNEEESRAYIDQLWAEAMTIYNSGDYRLAFSPAMQETLQAHQQDFMQEDAQAGMIYAFLEDYTGDRVCSKQLYAEALGNTNIPAEWETRAICEIMNTGISRGDIQGWQAHKTAKRYPKYGVQKGWERVTSPETGAEDFSEITDAEAQQLGFPF